MPGEIQHLIDLCEANVVRFNNDQMSAALHFAESLWSENESIRGELAHMRDTDAIQDRQALLENVVALQARFERCDHGVVDGSWCEQCNRDMKEARRDPSNGNGETT